MHSKSVLGQAEVARLLAAARQDAQIHQWQVTIAVVDDGGHPLALERMDGCAPASAYIAMEKPAARRLADAKHAITSRWSMAGARRSLPRLC